MGSYSRIRLGNKRAESSTGCSSFDCLANIRYVQTVPRGRVPIDLHEQLGNSDPRD